MYLRKSNKGIPILSKKDIEEIAYKTLFEYDKNLIEKPIPIPIEDIIENYLGLELDFKNLDANNEILGLIAFNSGVIKVFNDDAHEEPLRVKEGTVIINNTLASDSVQENRYRFTCAHEASHWILHREKFLVNKNQISLFDLHEGQETIKMCMGKDIGSTLYRKTNNFTDDDWLEWQADYLAGSLLLPLKSVKEYFNSLLKQLSITSYELNSVLNEKQSNKVKVIVDEISNKYKVSKQATNIRLIKIGLLKENANQYCLF